MVKMTEAVVNAVKLPVTVKTRLGYDDEHKEIVEIAEKLQDVGIQALTIHGRTRTQRPRIPADWTLIGEVKNNPRMRIPIFGNGDVVDAESAKYFKDNFGVDGLMVARGVYGNPWIFKEIKHYLETGQKIALPDFNERMRISKIQLSKSCEWKGERRGVLEIRKHWGDYSKGSLNLKAFRINLMEAETEFAVLKILEEARQVYA